MTTFILQLSDLHVFAQPGQVVRGVPTRESLIEVLEKVRATGLVFEQVVVSGLYSAFAARRELTPDDLVFAIRDTVPLYQTYEEKIKALREWAENRARSASSKRRVLDFFESK